MKADFKMEVLGTSATLLAGTEIGLGSALHSAHVPFSGHFLSLNQSFILSRTSFMLRGHSGTRQSGFDISVVVALLKSLSPVGKKLTPMLAISTQGFLFSIGTTLFGNTPIGCLCGSLLLSLWAFAQPLLIYLLIFGSTLIAALSHLLEQIAESFSIEAKNLYLVLFGLVLLKALLASAVAIAAFWLPEKAVLSYLLKFNTKSSTPIRAQRAAYQASRPSLAALRDLLNPYFFLSLCMTLGFFFFVESSQVSLIWQLLRPISVGYIIFYILRIFPAKEWVRCLERTPLRRWAPLLNATLEKSNRK